MSLTIVRRSWPLPWPVLDPQMHPVLQRVYAARGVRGVHDLELSMQQLLPIGTLGGVEAAAELLCQHRQRGGLVLIIGDFDADGATSTAVFVRALRSWGFAAVDFLVPNRFEFGYGLTPEIVALAATQHPALIVTVDNGISSNAGVAAARAAGIEGLITDHHLPGLELPPANVIVNPNVPGSAFGSRALAGVGVAFYVIAALRRMLEARGLLPPGALMAAELLDLVALGTVADVVPFDANNRILQDLRELPMQLPGDKERTPVDKGNDLLQVIAIEYGRTGEFGSDRPEGRPVDLHLVLLRLPKRQILFGRFFIGEIVF